MEAHPITDYLYRWVPALAVALLLAVVQTVLMRCYTGADWLPSMVDGTATISWFMALAYLAWFIVGTVSMYRTNVIVAIAGIAYIPFAPPFLSASCSVFLPGQLSFCGIICRLQKIPHRRQKSSLSPRQKRPLPCHKKKVLTGSR